MVFLSVYFFLTDALSRRFILSHRIQHILNEDAISHRRIIYKNMGKVMIPTRFDGLSNTESVE